jgi:hypothetical protein
MYELNVATFFTFLHALWREVLGHPTPLRGPPTSAVACLLHTSVARTIVEDQSH